MEDDRGFSRPDRSHRLAVDAERYRRSGDSVAAGALARVALERRLRELCRAHHVQPQPPGNAMQCLATLRGRKKIDRATYQRLKPVLKTANRCAHGADVDPLECAELVFTVSDFLNRHPRPSTLDPGPPR